MLAAYTPIQEAGANIGTGICIPATNAIESLNRAIRKSIKTCGSFPTDDAAAKLIYLAIRKFEKDGRNVRDMVCSPETVLHNVRRAFRRSSI